MFPPERCNRTLLSRRTKGQRLSSDTFDAVLGAAKTGAGWALTRLYHDLSPLVLAYLRMQHAVEPEDLTSDVFLGAFRNLTAFEGTERQFRSWLLTIAHRRLLDERKRLQRGPTLVELDARVPHATDDVEAAVMASAGNERISQMLAALSEDQRQVLLMRIVGELSITEIAVALGKRPAAVKQLQRRGLNVLRERFTEKGVAP